MRRLVALDIPGGPGFVSALQRCFDEGDAVLPIDGRLGDLARTRLIEAMRPAAVIDATGTETALSQSVPIEPGDAIVVATSGTTGTPKGVVLTHDAVAASARATSRRLGVKPGQDQWLCCLPLAHVGGLSVVLRALTTGTALEVLPAFDLEAVRTAPNRGATRISLVPTTLGRLRDTDIAMWQTILLGGSDPPEVLADNVVTTYGMTETGSGVVYDGLPLDGVEIAIETGGQILVRAPMCCRSYRDGIDPKRPDGFYPTGDAGRVTEDGRLEVYGRLGDLIISGGENVWPVAIETIIERDPDVAEVAIVGVADPEWGERVVALVVPVPGKHPQLIDLATRVRDEIGPWACPKALVEVERLPHTAIGKLARSQLASIARQLIV